VLIRCQACQRVQPERPQCIGCGAGLPVIERLDGRAVQLRQRAVVALLMPAERDALAAVVSGLGLVGSWWRVRAVHDVFVLLAGQRRVEQLMARGESRTAALRQVAGELGMSRWETLRDMLNRLLAEKGAP